MNYKALLVFCGLTSATSPAFAESHEITIQVWGSTWQNLYQGASKRFEDKTGIKVNVVTQSSSGEGLVKLQADRDHPNVDIWFTTNAVAATAAADQKLFTKIPREKLTNYDQLIKGGATEDWVGAYYYPLGIIYDADSVPAAPTSWQDLWKPEYKNQIVAPAMSIFEGSLMLVANQINGGTVDNVAPGFAALEKLNPNISLYYTSDSQARQSMAQGEGSILIGEPTHMTELKAEGINAKMISPKPTPMYFDVMMMVRGAHQDEAAKFIDFVISQGEQVSMTNSVNMAPVNKNATPSEILRATLPAEGDGVVFDGKYIASHISDWTARFEKIATH